MKRNLMLFACLGILLIGGLSGCREQKAIALVNTLTFSTGDFQNLRLDYDADDIHVLKSDNDKVIVKEYMNEDQKSYYAKTTIKKNELLITEGKRPRNSGFDSYIEVYIPQNYIESLSLHSTSGIIESEVSMNLSGGFDVDTTSGRAQISNIKATDVKITSTNGKLSFKNIDADTITIQTTNAATAIEQASGVISYQSKRGKLIASRIQGSGSFRASGEGDIDISFTDATGDIGAYSKNGTIKVGLPGQIAFRFSAKTKEGSIDTSFADQLAVTDQTATGTVGSDPEILIELETRNGDIQVIR